MASTNTTRRKKRLSRTSQATATTCPPAQLSRELTRWTQSLDLSYTIRNPKRDFANGVLIAEIVSKYYKRDIPMHGLINGTGMKVRRDNWTQLRKFLSKLPQKNISHRDQADEAGADAEQCRREELAKISEEEELIEGVINCDGSAVLKLLNKLYRVLTGREIKAISPPIEDEHRSASPTRSSLSQPQLSSPANTRLHRDESQTSYAGEYTTTAKGSDSQPEREIAFSREKAAGSVRRAEAIESLRTSSGSINVCSNDSFETSRNTKNLENHRNTVSHHTQAQTDGWAGYPRHQDSRRSLRQREAKDSRKVCGDLGPRSQQVTHEDGETEDSIGEVGFADIRPHSARQDEALFDASATTSIVSAVRIQARGSVQPTTFTAATHWNGRGETSIHYSTESADELESGMEEAEQSNFSASEDLRELDAKISREMASLKSEPCSNDIVHACDADVCSEEIDEDAVQSIEIIKRCFRLARPLALDSASSSGSSTSVQSSTFAAAAAAIESLPADHSKQAESCLLLSSGPSSSSSAALYSMLLAEFAVHSPLVVKLFGLLRFHAEVFSAEEQRQHSLTKLSERYLQVLLSLPSSVCAPLLVGDARGSTQCPSKDRNKHPATNESSVLKQVYSGLVCVSPQSPRGGDRSEGGMQGVVDFLSSPTSFSTSSTTSATAEDVELVLSNLKDAEDAGLLLSMVREREISLLLLLGKARCLRIVNTILSDVRARCGEDQRLDAREMELLSCCLYIFSSLRPIRAAEEEEEEVSEPVGAESRSRPWLELLFGMEDLLLLSVADDALSAASCSLLQHLVLRSAESSPKLLSRALRLLRSQLFVAALRLVYQDKEIYREFEGEAMGPSSEQGLETNSQRQVPRMLLRLMNEASEEVSTALRSVLRGFEEDLGPDVARFPSLELMFRRIG